MVARRDSLQSLSTIAQIIQKSKPSENPLAHIVEIVREQMKVDVCSLYLLEEKKLILVATSGLDPKCIGKVRMNVHEGLTGLAVEKLQPVIVKKPNLHPRYKYFPQTHEEEFNTFAAFPLMDRDRVVGVLTVQTIEERDLTIQEVELLKLFAFQLAGVIRNLVTLEEVLAVERKTTRPTLQLKGIPVAPGFGIGRAFLLRSGKPIILPIQRSGGGLPRVEWKRLSEAIRKASHDLLRLEKKLEKRFSKTESDIFYSHRMILSDKSFLKRLKGYVEKGASAEEAVQDVIGGYIEEFEKMSEPHFRERAADLIDLRERVSGYLLGRKMKKPQLQGEGVLVAETLVPSDTARLDPKCIQAILTERGGTTSHAAIIARSLGIPAVMGIPHVASRLQSGDLVIVDGNLGTVYLNPEPAILREYEKMQEKFADRILTLKWGPEGAATTRDEKRILVEANVGLFTGLQKLHEYGAEGVGLYRTEFPFMVKKKLLDEREQYDLYKKIIQEVRGLPVTFRLLDAGGDKPVEALGITGLPETNPFLGYRSIRLSLSRPEILRTQLRALLKASTEGSIRILIPMISGVEEIRAVKKIMQEIQQDLRKEKIPFDEKIPIGILMEVPSAVWMASLLIHDADFFSIGTNDLIQYTLAVDRNNEQVAQFFEPLHPAVLQAIGHIARIAEQAGKRVSVCGEMAGDPMMVPLLIGLGVNSLSMIPSSIPIIRSVLQEISYEEVKKITDQALRAATIEEVRELLRPMREKVQKILTGDSEDIKRGLQTSLPNPERLTVVT